MKTVHGQRSTELAKPVKVILIVLLFCLSKTSFSQSTPGIITDWMNFAGISDTLTVIPVVKDDSSNIISVGVNVDSITGPDILVTKLDTAGSLVWQQTYSGTGFNRDQAIAVAVDDSCSIYVAGVIYSSATNFDWIILKYSSAGSLLWTYTLNGTANNYDAPAAIKIKNNFVYATGELYDSLTQLNYCTIQLNSATGALNWKREYDFNSLFDIAFVMDISENENLIKVAGASQDNILKWNYCSISYDSAGVAHDTIRIGGTANSFDRPMAARCDVLGNFYITGAASDSGASFNVRTAKIDSAGNLSWVADFGSNGKDDQGNDIIVDDSGYVYVCGKTNSYSSINGDLVLLKYGNNGTLQHYDTYDADSAADEAYKMCFDNYGNIVMTGMARWENSDILTLAYSRAGDLLWKIFFKGEYGGQDRGTGITSDFSGNIFVTGEVQHTDTSWQQITIKYKTDYFLVPQDTVPAPSSLLFYPNKGQIIDTQDSIRSDVSFYTINQFPKLYFHGDSISFVMAQVDSDTATTDTLERITMNFVYGNLANSEPYTSNTHDSDQVLNYFLGHCPDGVTGITGSEKIMYSEVYDKTDVIFSNNNAGMKFQIIMNPGAEPQAVLHFTGHQDLQLVNNADLQVSGVLGSFIYERPLVYQLDSLGNRISLGWLASYYIVDSANVSFQLLGQYDNQLPLVVECAREVIPSNTQAIGNLQWSVFYGDISDDLCESVTTDNVGNMYSTGFTNSDLPFPTTPNVVQAFLSGSYDVYINKFINLHRLKWSTYYGGSDLEQSFDIAVDASQNVYFVGRTKSSDFPVNPRITTGGALAPGQDAFIVALDPDGANILWANYIGGEPEDIAYAVTILDHFVYIAGETSYIFPGLGWQPFPIVSSQCSGSYNQHDAAYNGGPNSWPDGFIIKFDIGAGHEGDQLWGTYFGSHNTDGITDIKAIGGGIFITGVSTSWQNGNNPCGVPTNFGFPICHNGGDYFQNAGGGSDHFIAEFDGCENLKWSTYVGGSGDEGPMPCLQSTVNQNNYTVYIAGSTSSNGAPFAASHGNSYNQSFQGGIIDNTDSYIIKFVNRQLTWSTFFGGDGDEKISGIASDNYKTYFIGTTTSSTPCSLAVDYCNLPTNSGEFPLCNSIPTYFFQTRYQDFTHSECNIFLSAFDNTTDEIIWSTYFAESLEPFFFKMGLDFSSTTQSLYFGTWNQNNNVQDYPVMIPNSGTPWSQNHRIGDGEAVYARFDVSTLVGINELTSIDFSLTLFPNPGDKKIGIKTNNILKKDFNLIVYNSSGQIILSEYVHSDPGKKIEISTVNFANGIYLVKLILSDGQTFDQKIIIQH